MTLNLMPFALVSSKEFVVATRPLKINGKLLQVGDPFPKEGTQKAIQALYITNRIEVRTKPVSKPVVAKAAPATTKPVTVKAKDKGSNPQS